MAGEPIRSLSAAPEKMTAAILLAVDRHDRRKNGPIILDFRGFTSRFTAVSSIFTCNGNNMTSIWGENPPKKLHLIAISLIRWKPI